MKEPHDELHALGQETEPTAAEVAALLDGSLEEDRRPAATRRLLRELGAPAPEDVARLKASVVDALEHPAPASRRGWIVLVVLGIAAVAWLVL